MQEQKLSRICPWFGTDQLERWSCHQLSCGWSRFREENHPDVKSGMPDSIEWRWLEGGWTWYSRVCGRKYCEIDEITNGLCARRKEIRAKVICGHFPSVEVRRWRGTAT